MVKSTELLSFDTICRIAYDLKRNGKRIGFTHGAFDLFHYGHLNFLYKTAQKCDFLVVGIDCDENIKKYKSYARPIIGEDQRLRIINELNCVNASFINKWGIEDVWIDLGKELKPDFLFIGGEYGKPADRLRREVDKIGAKLIRTRHEFETTTDIVKRIIKSQSRIYPAID